MNRYFWYRNTRHFSHQRHFYTETCSRNNRVQNLRSLQDKETIVKNTVTSNITHTYSKRKWLAFWSYHKIELSNHLFLFLCCDSVPVWPNVIIHHLPPCWQPANYEHMDRQALTVCEQRFDSKKMHNQSYLFCCQWQNYQDKQWPELRSPKSWTQ